jgi:glycerol-3-phosphate O-acyltransferase / dihydroxyacetone phosphate acyltransferase
MEARRRLAFLIAEKSMKRKFVGAGASAVGALPVGRALDNVKPAKGKIYLPDPVNDPTLLRGVGTNFDTSAFQVGGLIVLPTVKGQTASTDISEIISAEEIRLKKPFKGKVALEKLTGRNDISDDGKIMNGNGGIGKDSNFEGTNFKVAPHIDQTIVYDAVFQRLNEGGCVGIFPEGGSHDRTELLPLKGSIPPTDSRPTILTFHTAGVAIMALGALAANPDCGLKIVPCGMNYFHAHKFRSRAVVEFGNPVEVPPELVEMYKRGQRREAVGQLLETVYQALVAVTVTSPDYDTLMVCGFPIL